MGGAALLYRVSAYHAVIRANGAWGKAASTSSTSAQIIMDAIIMAPSTDRMTVLEAAQAQQKAAPAQAAVMVLFILLFMVRVIVTASLRFGNVGAILAKQVAEVNSRFAKNIIIPHNSSLYRLCNLHNSPAFCRRSGRRETERGEGRPTACLLPVYAVSITAGAALTAPVRRSAGAGSPPRSRRHAGRSPPQRGWTASHSAASPDSCGCRRPCRA